MSRAVRLNPLTVLVSVLLAAELGGLVGALLTIPAASIVQILLREFVPAAPQAASAPDEAGPGDHASDGRRRPAVGHHLRDDRRAPGCDPDGPSRARAS